MEFIYGNFELSEIAYNMQSNQDIYIVKLYNNFSIMRTPSKGITFILRKNKKIFLILGTNFINVNLFLFVFDGST